MKRIMLICGLLLSIITFANAQQGGGRQMATPEERATRMTDQLTEKLKLTADQKTKVMAIFLDQNKAMQKMREEAGNDRAAMREKMMKAMKESDDKVNAVLTEEQQKAYKAWQEERRAAMQNRGGGMGGQGSGQNQ